MLLTCCMCIVHVVSRVCLDLCVQCGSWIYTKVAIGVKRDTCLQALVDNPKWQGAVASISDVTVPKDSLPDGTLCGSEERGGGAKMISLKQGHRRTGCAAIPMAYSACLLRGMGAEVCVVALPMIEFLKEGITVSNIDQFLESGPGINYFKDHGVMHVLVDEQWMFIPNGFVVFLVACEGLKDKAAMPETLIHFPLLAKEWLAEIPESLRGIIVAKNLEQFEAKAANTMWCEWAVAFKELFVPEAVSDE
jgi:hypothetical protein